MHKRQMLSIVALFVCSLGNLAWQVQADDWPQFGGPQSNFQIRQTLNFNAAPTVSKCWQKTLGPGMSGMAVEADWLYTSYLVPFADDQKTQSEKERVHRETVVAYDRHTGKLRWQYDYDAQFIESQQAFGGRSRAPQSTPCIAGELVYTIGFTGKLHAINRFDGQLRWKVDLVERCQATPVQFGFSASPIAIGKRLVVLAGGKKGGLLCLDRFDGSPIWNVPCEEASYATPLIWECDGNKQIVFMTRKMIMGVDAANGKECWRYQLPKTGLTNVPTPLVVDECSLIISGQGIGGCKRLRVKQQQNEKQEDSWIIEEVWSSDEQFFYCNWMIRQGVLLGCSGDILMAIDVATGKRIGRWRGYAESNLVATEDTAFVLDGNGWLTAMSFGKNKLQVLSKVQVLNARCWTPPTLVDNHVYCRGDDQLACLAINATDRDALPSARVGKRELKWDFGNEAVKETVKPVAQVIEAYRTSEAAAWNTYKKLRRNRKLTFTKEDRKTLAALARGEELTEFADQIETDLALDFPNKSTGTSAPPESKTPSSDTQQADNGLLYLEFGIRNQSLRTVHALVKGPAKHPFGYGLPLRPGQTRIEKWPVGTKLYRANNEIRGELLLEVQPSYSGKVIRIK